MMEIQRDRICEEDSLFRTELTRVLRTELEDAQKLRDPTSSQSLGSLPFITSNILKLPKMNIDTPDDSIDQNRISIEVIHDPSRCSISDQHHFLRSSKQTRDIDCSSINKQNSSFGY